MFHFIVPIKDKTIVEKYLLPSLKDIKQHKNVILTDGEAGICLKYNMALQSLNAKLDDKDVIVFCHDDIIVRDKLLLEKVQMYFDYMSDIGIAGVIGANTYHKDAGGGWWHCNRGTESAGSIIQGSPDKESYEMNDKPGMFDDMVIVDGCILFMSGKVAKWFRFDHETHKNYHFYDASACFQLLSQGYKVGTIDVKIEHKSEGELPGNWKEERDIFLKKWGHLKFPVTVSSFK